MSFCRLLHNQGFPTGTIGWPAALGLFLLNDDDM